MMCRLRLGDLDGRTRPEPRAGVSVVGLHLHRKKCGVFCQDN